MSERNWLSDEFERHRAKLRAIAQRMLGSPAEAEDAVQEAWLKVSRADSSEVENLGGWLTTVVARVCLDMLRSRKLRHEEALDVDREARRGGDVDPERDVLLAESVVPALVLVLDSLAPAERVAFVLHDVFALSFEEVAPIVRRSVLAS